MSYSVFAVGTKEEAVARVVETCDSNTSPEMPAVKNFLLSLLAAIDGDDKRVVIEANGWHSGGAVSHDIKFRTASVLIEVPPSVPLAD